MYVCASRERATSHARSRRQSIRSVISGATKNPFSIRAEHSTLAQIFSFASVSRCSIVLVVRDTAETFRIDHVIDDTFYQLFFFLAYVLSSGALRGSLRSTESLVGLNKNV